MIRQLLPDPDVVLCTKLYEKMSYYVQKAEQIAPKTSQSVRKRIKNARCDNAAGFRLRPLLRPKSPTIDASTNKEKPRRLDLQGSGEWD